MQQINSIEKKKHKFLQKYIKLKKKKTFFCFITQIQKKKQLIFFQNNQNNANISCNAKKFLKYKQKFIKNLE